MNIIAQQTAEKISDGMRCASGEKKSFRVDWCGRKSAFDNARDTYTAGEEVTVYFMGAATDTNYTFSANGKTLVPQPSDRGGVRLSFVMPAQDVTFRVESRNTMNRQGRG